MIDQRPVNRWRAGTKFGEEEVRPGNAWRASQTLEEIVEFPALPPDALDISVARGEAAFQ